MLYSYENIYRKFQTVFRVEHLTDWNTKDFTLVGINFKKYIDFFEMEIEFDYKDEQLALYIETNGSGIKYSYGLMIHMDERLGMLACLQRVEAFLEEDPQLRLFRLLNDLPILNEHSISHLKRLIDLSEKKQQRAKKVENSRQ